jgi:hypothetical protein
MHPNDEAELLRIETANQAIHHQERVHAGEGGAARVVALTTKITTYPTVAAGFYGMTTETITGTEVEGGPGTMTSYGSTFYALNLGTTIPAVGTSLECTFVSNRWVFRYDG